MAKKQAAEKAATPPAEGTSPPPAEGAAKPPKGEGKKKREPKAKTDPAAPAATAAPAPAASPDVVAPVAKAPSQPSEPGKKKKKPGVPPPRGKKLRNHLKNLKQKLTKEGPSALPKAVQLLKQMKRSKFDETIEIHMWLGVDTTQSDQLIRGTVALPHGI